MKKSLLSLSLIVGFALSMGFVFFPATANAAAPVCYTQIVGTSAGPIRTSACGNRFQAAARSQLRHPLRDDKCYLLANLNGELTIYEGTPRQCQEWSNRATAPPPPPTSNPSTGENTLENPSRDAAIDCDGGNCVNRNYLVVMAKWAVNVLSALVGVVIVASIVMAGIQYSSSAGDPGKTAQAKGRIVNAVIALVAYMFLFVGLQWLIPGGLFG